jgi:hypothetical protein
LTEKRICDPDRNQTPEVQLVASHFTELAVPVTCHENVNTADRDARERHTIFR